MRTLHLFPDTNVFIQCRPLEQLDWSAWAEFDEVRLIVCRPVQREIDNQKGRGSDRVGKKARQTHTLFREIIIGADGYRLIRDAAPQVKLLVEPSFVPSPELQEHLDYSKTDDQIVGCLHTFCAACPDEDVRLLTHDSGPMATAKMLSLPFVPVPDNWLIPPESNEQERENRRLESELDRLKKAGPQFRVVCVDDHYKEIDALEFEFRTYEPLTDTEIATLIEALQTRSPLATDFGRRDRIERDLPSSLPIHGMTEAYEPASDEDIAKYQGERYPAWLQECEQVLRNLHTSLQREAGPPTFRFAAVNEGARPGRDVLITFEAKGNFEIRPPDWRDNTDNEDEEAEGGEITSGIVLPVPPTPPRGKWTTNNPFRAFEALQRQLKPFGRLESDMYGPALTLPKINSRDPNAFYYKPNRPMMPAGSFSLECEQWRHNVEPEVFEGEIYFNGETEQVRGALECMIHAANLSDPVRKTVPVRISVTLGDIHDRADALLQELVRRAGE